MKFECVKEVIARGVTLRRGELWKKIRNGEPKPNGLSDRTWRTLGRQLDNPASIRKSENCRKANASRVNFGRTGPSDEVGMRQRMKRILRRSPDPEEIRLEMARDKGHIVHQGRNENNLNVKDGRGGQQRLPMDLLRICAEPVKSPEDSTEDEDTHTLENASHEVDAEDLRVGESARKGSGVSVSSMSLKQISEHPFVAMMMQRLEALEARPSTAVVEERREGKDVLQETGAQHMSPDFEVLVQRTEDAAGLGLKLFPMSWGLHSQNLWPME